MILWLLPNLPSLLKYFLMSSLVSHCIFVVMFFSLSYFARYCCSTQNPCEVSFIATCLIAVHKQSCGAHVPILKYFGSQSYTLWLARCSKFMNYIFNAKSLKFFGM
jgi:hypothetical protein